jgi:hypothetical protein
MKEKKEKIIVKDRLNLADETGKTTMKPKQKLTKKDIKKAKKRFQNRNITKANKLYWYLVLSGIFMFTYSISCIFTHFPFLYTFLPIVLILGYFILLMLKRNWKVIWLYVRDTEQGRLLLFLNNQTHFSEEHKLKLIQWVYLRRKHIRNEISLKLRDKVMNGEKLDPTERVLIKFKTVYCPQQLLDGFNKAHLINALIWAHVNVHLLDQELRDILELTDERMSSFRIQDEVDKCKKK